MHVEYAKTCIGPSVFITDGLGREVFIEPILRFAMSKAFPFRVNEKKISTLWEPHELRTSLLGNISND